MAQQNMEPVFGYNFTIKETDLIIKSIQHTLNITCTYEAGQSIIASIQNQYAKQIQQQLIAAQKEQQNKKNTAIENVEKVAKKVKPENK